MSEKSNERTQNSMNTHFWIQMCLSAVVTDASEAITATTAGETLFTARLCDWQLKQLTPITSVSSVLQPLRDAPCRLHARKINCLYSDTREIETASTVNPHQLLPVSVHSEEKSAGVLLSLDSRGQENGFCKSEQQKLCF